MNTFLRLTARVESRELVTEEFSIGSEDKKKTRCYDPPERRVLGDSKWTTSPWNWTMRGCLLYILPILPNHNYHYKCSLI